MTGMRNLVDMWNRADAIDRAEGVLAYERYHQVLAEIAEKYIVSQSPVVAAFVALSPNNDYIGNLRSLVSLLAGMKFGTPLDQITISTYNHCRDRAWKYLHGEPFNPKGLKILNFYNNILFPDDPAYVTIDGHMIACWRGTRATMKESIVKPKQYKEIADDVTVLAAALGIMPNQLQATLWFTRKRVLNIKYDAQLKFDDTPTDLWRTTVNIDELKPYPLQTGKIKSKHEVRQPSNHPVFL